MVFIYRLTYSQVHHLFSEQKIDDIKKGVDGINQLLQGLDLNPSPKKQEYGRSYEVLHSSGNKNVYSSVVEPEWDYSGHIVDFIRAVVHGRNKRLQELEHNSVVSSLRTLLHTLEGNRSYALSSIPKINAARHQGDSLMPPLDAAVSVLRWAKCQ